MIKLVIAEDHQILIDGLISMLDKETDIKVVGNAIDGQELIDIVQEKRPNVVLTDVRMPKCDGIQATKFITQHFPETKVIAFSMFEQEDAVVQMRNAGALGYLVKSASYTELVSAIRQVGNGIPFFDTKIAVHYASIQETIQLSKREKDILRLIADGKSSQEIADILNLGKSTIDSHRKNIIKKFDLNGKSELIRFAVERKYEF